MVTAHDHNSSAQPSAEDKSTPDWRNEESRSMENEHHQAHDEHHNHTQRPSPENHTSHDVNATNEEIPARPEGHTHAASREPENAESKPVHDQPLHQPGSRNQPAHAGHGNAVDHTGHEDEFRRRFWVSLALSIPVLLFSAQIQEWFGYTLPTFTGSNLITPAFSVGIFVYGGLPFLRMAMPEIRNRKPGMMTLISLAISVAFIYSMAALFMPGSMPFFWELVTLIDIMLLGHWIEMRSVRQASGALRELAKLMPDTAERIQPGGGTQTVSVEELMENDLILVRPGASVAADGIIQEGESNVNEAMITGESRPVRKTSGSKVIAGTINGDGSLRVRVTATGDKTALAGIMRLVEQAQKSRSNTQILADKAAGWLFYIALAVAVITAIAWTIATGFDAEVVARVATVLVIACPHALGLAVPLVVAISTSIGARNGILVRNRLALEEARLIDTVIFDKTGTLTEGEFGVVAIKTISSMTEDQCLTIAAAIEADSEHSIARGIRKLAERRQLAIPSISEFQAIKGRGASGSVDGHPVYIGGPRLVEMLNIILPDELDRFTDEASKKGQSVVHLVYDGKPVASFALADIIREESRQVVNQLHSMDIKVAMLTGDSQEVAQAVASELGIDTFFAEVVPENKDRQVSELQKQGKKVAMVGDGVNDAPALARANVGIAIGSGTDVAVESAGIILVKSNLFDVVKIFELSKASYRKMVQNLAWAAGYNLFALPLAAGILAPSGILLSPAVGALLMSLSTVIVAINAQLLRRHKLSSVLN